MLKAINKWIGYLIKRWRPRKYEEPAAQAAPKRKMTVNKGGKFYFREDILDQLPRLHDHLSRLKQADPDAYDFHSQYGARIVPPNHNVNPDDLGEISSAGMVFSNGIDTGEKISASFIYFKELKGKHICKPNDGRVFCVSASYDLDRKHCVAFEFYLNISGNNIDLCKTMQRGSKYIKSRINGNRGPITYRKIPQIYWGYGDRLQEIAHENNCDPAKLARSLFIIAASGWISATDEGLVIRCNDGKTVATFNIDTKRTPYFFKDRITALAADGKRKRIFHSVRKHTRDMGGGEEVEVKAHYRGERHFSWGGDKVSITVPGLHHGKGWAAFSPVSHDAEDLNDTTGFLNAEQTGRKIAQYLSR